MNMPKRASRHQSRRWSGVSEWEAGGGEWGEEADEGGVTYEDELGPREEQAVSVTQAIPAAHRIDRTMSIASALPAPESPFPFCILAPAGFEPATKRL